MIAVTLGSFDIGTNDNEERQERVAEALTTLWGKFVGAGFWPASDNREQHIVVSISLTPEWGQAGIAIASESLRPWLDAGAQLNVNAYTKN